MPRCRVRWKRNPHRACSPSIFHGYSEVAALGHASFNLARSTRAVKTPNPRRPIAFPCCRRLLYVYSKSFPVLLSLPLSHSLSRVRLPATLSSCPRLEIPSSEILDFRGRCFCCEIVVPSRNKIARAAANITRPQSTELRSRFSFRSTERYEI